MALFLETIRRRPHAAIDEAFPWSVSALRSLQTLRFTAPVTFFMGENGSGKSTLLEAIALAAGAATAGALDIADDTTLTGAGRLAATLVLQRRAQPRARMFFRAEDAFGFTRRIESEMRALDVQADALLGDKGAGLQARRRAAGYVRGQRAALAASYGDDPHAQSHGETFLAILRRRIAAPGLYLLDEPETPLSPTRVLALLSLVYEAAREGSQFIVATHSPILAALPGAQILLFENGTIGPAAYDDLEHVRVTRDFLVAPHRYLRHLIDPQTP
jgi:predicted ATPase